VSSETSLYYNYFKKDGEKKEVGRLWKNIIFPGIYREYADTKEPLATVKIETKSDVKKSNSRNNIDSFFSEDTKTGTYNVGDATCAPTYADMSSIINSKKLKPVSKPANFVAPTPKKASNGGGIATIPNINTYLRPSKPIIIYESEASVDCRKVREACTMLDLVVEYRPCPGGIAGHSDQQAILTQGRREIPFMIDNNPNIYRPQLYGNTEIVDYLFETYGPGSKNVPKSLKEKSSGGGSNGIGNFFKNSKVEKLRANARSDNSKMKAITLYGFEGVSYVKIVQQTLCELGLAHLFINVAQGSLNRVKLEKKTNIFQVPFIVDPNTGVEMFESNEIVKYLESTYTV